MKLYQMRKKSDLKSRGGKKQGSSDSFSQALPKMVVKSMALYFAENTCIV